MSTKRIALIPAYEPDFNLIELTEELRRERFDIVIVNDGSITEKNGIFRRCEEFGKVLTHACNKGKGFALKTGLGYISRHFEGDYTVVTLDADGQHTVADAIRVCEAAEAEPDALILGSRGFDRDVPLRSRFGNTMTRLVYRLTTGLAVRDTQTGLRAFSNRLTDAMRAIRGDRYEYEMNVLLTFARRKVPIREVEIATIYIDENAASHFDTVRDSVRIYKEILKFSASSFIGFLTDYTLFAVLSLLTGMWGAAGLAFSNIAARCVSAAVNFNINRKLVFRSTANPVRSGLKYFALAAGILAGNTWVLSLLVGAGMNRFAAKLLTEVSFFVISWLMQRFVVFGKAPETDDMELLSDEEASETAPANSSTVLVSPVESGQTFSYGAGYIFNYSSGRMGQPNAKRAV